jgi:putative membrane protein
MQASMAEFPAMLATFSREDKVQAQSMRYGGVFTAIVTAMVLGGCRGGGNQQAAQGAPPAAETGTTQPGAAAPAPGAVSSANIAALVNEANVADSTLAAEALPKLTDSDVKAFAQQMMVQHHQLHVEGLKAAQEANITPQLPSPDPFAPAVAAERNALSSMSPGRAYDSTYIAHEVAIHQAVIDWLGQPGHQQQNPVYQKYLQEAGPVLQQHLKEARALQQKLGSSTGA